MSKILRGYKYRIHPTEEQATKIDDFINYTRFIYNWAIEKEDEIYQQFQLGLSQYKLYSFIDLEKILKEEIKTNPKLYFVQKYPTATTKLALKNAEQAFKNYCTHLTGYPKFKRKKTCKKSFATRHDTFGIRNDRIKIEGIDTCIDLNFDCGINIRRTTKEKAQNVVLYKDNLGDYYVSFSLEKEIEPLNVPKTEGIGIDLGMRKTFALSTGEVFIQPDEKLKKLERRRNRQHSHVTRDRNRRKAEAKRTRTKYEDIPKSKRAIKREINYNKTCKKIHNIKNTFYHTITKQIVMRNPEFVCMETFSVRQLQRDNPYLSKDLSRISFYDITQKMKYKCENYNIPFIQAPNDFASTQICSNCGHKKKMYSYHRYVCPVCSMRIDRDMNAAINLKQYGLDLLYSYIQK